MVCRSDVNPNVRHLVKKIADAMGLKSVRSLEIRLACNEVVTIRAEMYPSDEQVNAIVKDIDDSAIFVQGK